VGIGSTFQATVRVGAPARTEFAATSSKTLSAVRHEVPHQELLGRRILVVEDLPDNQALLRILLTDAGATVEVAGDGEQGVRAALRGAHDAVLMDIQMPNVDGYTAARRLRAQGYAQPIIALTAHAMKDERQQILAAGFSDYLSKPIVRELLIGALQRCAPTKPQLTVVMVDDDEDLLGVMSLLLSERHYAIVAVRSAAEALTAIDSISGPLVVMTDLSMPGVSGDMLGRQLRERPDRRRMRVLAVSGWQDVEERARAFGADGFVRKPFDLQKMLALIAQFSHDLATT
jgi:CheY-like chemotaxis protein